MSNHREGEEASCYLICGAVETMAKVVLKFFLKIVFLVGYSVYFLVSFLSTSLLFAVFEQWYAIKIQNCQRYLL